MMTFNFGNADGLFVPVTTDGDNTYIVGNGNNDVVIAASSSIRDVITLGNGNNDQVQIGDFFTNAGNAQGDTITLGDGNDDSVFIIAFRSQLSGHNTITLGNGNNDAVVLQILSTLPNVITLGDGDGDVVQGHTLAQGGTGDQITVGNGKNDAVVSGGGSTISVGDGDGAVVWTGGQDQITVGNGNNDTVFSQFGYNTITVGNGNDTIHVATNDTVAVGKGQDVFVFDSFFEKQPGGIGAVTITGFNPSKDVIVIQQTLATSFAAHDDVHGNAVVTFPNDGQDHITLVGVHASDLHASDFQFV
jgi:Ca2+-binding RTX toxin-like protein